MKTRLLVLLVVLSALGLALAGATLAQAPVEPIPTRAGDILPVPLAAPDWDAADLTPFTPPSIFDLHPSTATAPAVDLGEPGLSFRYVRTFGEIEVAYLADTAHLNFPYGVAADDTNVWIGEQFGRRALKFTNTGTFVSSIGTAGSDTSPLWDVNDLAVDSGGNTWVAYGDQVVKFNAAGNEVSRLWRDDDPETHFRYASSIAFDSAGNIYVSDGAPWWSVDEGDHRIQVFDSAGNYLHTIGVTGSTGTGNLEFHGPRHIEIHYNCLFVADSGNHRVQIYDISNPLTPAYVGTIGVTGQAGDDNAHLNQPSGVTVAPNYGNDTTGIFVADRENDRVQVFDYATRAYVTTISGSGSSSFKKPTDVAASDMGYLYVADFVNARVQQFFSRSYVRTYGVTGVPYLTDAYHYNSPAGVAVAPDGSIYIAEDMGHRLVKLNAAGQPQWTVGMPGLKGDWYWANDRLDNPADVALDSAGRVCVADRWHSRVQIYNADGTYYATVPDTHFDNVGGLTIAPNGYLYVADTGDHRVQIFDAGWNVIAQLGVTGQAGADNAHFNQPEDVAVDSRGVIYIADQQNHRVQVFNSDRVYVRTIGETGVCRSDFDHLCSPNSLAVDAADRLYIADTGNNRIQVFDADGAYLTTIGGSWGKLTAQLRGPEGVAVAANGDVFVADWGNHRVQKFAAGVPGWRQVNINGFGDRQNILVGSLDVLDGQMYAGTWSGADGYAAQVWRTADGHSWSQVTPSWSVSNTAVFDAQPFMTQLYVGTANDSSGGEIWRTDGVSWEQVASGGFGDANNYAINALAVFSGTIYGATANGTSGTQIWRSPTGASGSWTRADIAGFSGSGMSQDSAMDVFQGHLYIGFGRTAAGQSLGELWRTEDGLTWRPVFTDGLAAKNTNVSGMAEFRGDLYIGLRNSTSGGQVWRSSDGLVWQPVFTGGLGDPYNGRPYGLIVFNDALYVVFSNANTGAEVWRTADGSAWQLVVKGGWGDSNNRFADYLDKAAAIFGNRLYIGTENSVNGAEIWVKTLTADFTATPTRGAPPLTVQFTNISAGDFTTSQWDFGDGATSTEISPTHTYTAAGTYTVTLTVGDGTDTSTLSKPAYVVAMHSVYLPLVMRNWNFDPLLYDDFNDPAFNGAYNPALWLASDTTGYEIRQSNGALVFSNPVPAWRTVSMRLKRPEVRSLQGLSLLQARFKLDGNCTTEYADIHLQYSAQNVAEYDEWVAECRLCRGCYYQQTTSAVCSITLWKNGGSRFEYLTPGQLIDLDTWHLLRIETDSHTANLRFYLDGSLIGSHTPEDASTLLGVTTFQPKMVAWNSGDGVRCTRYVDDVRITPAQ